MKTIEDIKEARRKMVCDVGPWNMWQVDEWHPLPKLKTEDSMRDCKLPDNARGLNLKTYCFDLDGTLCTQTRNKDGKPEQNPEEVYKQAKPIQERINIVNDLYDLGNKIFIETARGSKYPHKKKDWLKMTEDQLKKWGVKYHALRLGVKLVADVYVDDMARSDRSFFRSPGMAYTFALDPEQDLFITSGK